MFGGSMLRGCPSSIQWMVGGGWPEALQFILAGSGPRNSWSSGCTKIFGGVS